MKLWNEVSDNLGFTLTEVLVGMAVLGVATGMVMQLVSLTMPLVRDVEARTSFHSVTEQIGAWIQNEQTCRRAFGGPGAVIGRVNGGDAEPDQILFPVDLEPATDTPEVDLLKIFDPAGTGPLGTRAALIVKDGAPVPTAPPDFQKWDFKKISLRLAPGQTNWRTSAINSVVLVLEAVPNGAASATTHRASTDSGMRSGSTDAAKTYIRFSVVIDANRKLASCGSLAFNSYQMTDGTAGSERIVSGGVMPSCSSGQAANFKSDGTMVCITVRCLSPYPNANGISGLPEGGIICGTATPTGTP